LNGCVFRNLFYFAYVRNRSKIVQLEMCCHWFCVVFIFWFSCWWFHFFFPCLSIIFYSFLFYCEIFYFIFIFCDDCWIIEAVSSFYIIEDTYHRLLIVQLHQLYLSSVICCLLFMEVFYICYFSIIIFVSQWSAVRCWCQIFCRDDSNIV
jgi:hypothetical protein